MWRRFAGHIPILEFAKDQSIAQAMGAGGACQASYAWKNVSHLC